VQYVPLSHALLHFPQFNGSFIRFAQWPAQQSRAIPRIEPRLAILSTLIALVLSVVTVRLYYLQIIRHKEFVQLADRNRIRIQPEERGR